MNESNMYAEVYKILEILGRQYINKIPEDLLKSIESRRNRDYVCNISASFPFDEQNIMDETIEFISFLNLEYWEDNEEEKQKLISIYAVNEKSYQAKLREKYNPDKIFSN